MKDNDFIVNNFVSEELIQELTKNMLLKSKNHIFYEKKYLEIFRLFCICDGKINSENQIRVLRKFIL